MKTLMANAIGFLEESKGVKSFIRLASGITIIVALLWGTLSIITSIYDKNFIVHSELILGTLTIGFCGKVIQKKHETNDTGTDEPIDQG